MYSLNCDYYTREFDNVQSLIGDVMMSGQDPNYEITHNGFPTGECSIDLIQF